MTAEIKKTRDEVTTEGVVAFRSHQEDSTCPYKSGGECGMSQERTWWMHGYWAAHVVHHVTSVNLTYMLSNRKVAT